MVGFWSRALFHTNLEDNGGEEEETERNNLDEEAENDDIFANLDSAAIEHQPGRTSLY